MDIGKEHRIIEVQPLEDPIPHQEPAHPDPIPQRAPRKEPAEPTPRRAPTKVPAKP